MVAIYVVNTDVVREGGLAVLTVVDEEFRDAVAAS